VDAYLDYDDVRGGVQPGECRLRSLSVYGCDVDSFCLDGMELATIDSSDIIELLGEPDKADEEWLGKTYTYYMPEKGISSIQFTFPGTLDTVAQIFVVFLI